MQDFQTVWTTQTGGTDSEGGDVAVTATDAGDTREQPLSGSTTVEGQGPLFDAIDASPFSREEVELLLSAAHVAGFLIVGYYAVQNGGGR